MLRPFASVLLVALCGCYGEAGLPMLYARASGDHGCPQDRIRVVRHSEGDPASLYVLDVCGQVRTYVDTGHRTHEWQEVSGQAN